MSEYEPLTEEEQETLFRNWGLDDGVGAVPHSLDALVLRCLATIRALKADRDCERELHHQAANGQEPMQARIRTLEAERDRLMARRCGTCGRWDGPLLMCGNGVAESYAGPPDFDPEVSADFCCSAWEARSPEDTDTDGE